MPRRLASYPVVVPLLLSLFLIVSSLQHHNVDAFLTGSSSGKSSAILGPITRRTSRQRMTSAIALLAAKPTDRENSVKAPNTRRHALETVALSFLGGLSLPITPASAASSNKLCTDIDSCREIGDLKADEKSRREPTIRLANGVDYKVLRAGTGSEQVKEGSILDIIYSISQSSGRYMYSKGFGYEKTNIGGKLQNDLGLESLRVEVGKHDVPVGIEEALVGMKRGERRRVQVPPRVGFETSNWKPEPPDRRAKLQIQAYKKILDGFGTQPPFPASTIWDVEVMRIRS